MKLQNANLQAAFKTAGCIPAELPILEPADVYFDLIGEDIRARLLLFETPGGRLMCLRPELTIPLCRMHIARTANSDSPPAPLAPPVSVRYGCAGTVFRYRKDRAREFPQAGMECIGREDRETADAEILAFAQEVLATFGVHDAILTLGDKAVFNALLEQLELPGVWRQRLLRHFGNPARMNALLRILNHTGTASFECATNDIGAAAEGVRAANGSTEEGTKESTVESPSPSPSPSPATQSKCLQTAYTLKDTPQKLKKLVAVQLHMAGIAEDGGRSAEEITRRFYERQVFESAKGIDAPARRAITQYLALDIPLQNAPGKLAEFAATHGVNLDDCIAPLAARNDAITATYKRNPHGGGDKTPGAKGTGLPRFSAGLGRSLSYYSGFVFEFTRNGANHVSQIGKRMDTTIATSATTSASAVLAAGGRYDDLLLRLGDPHGAPAVGCAVWLDRLPVTEMHEHISGNG